MKKYIIFVILCLFLINGNLFAQFYEETRMSGAGNPFFTVQLFRTIADNYQSGRLYVYSSIINDDLTFISVDSIESFRAEFEWEVSIKDENEEHTIGSRSIRKEVYETDYEETNNREKDILLSAVFDIPQAEYVVLLQMRDLISKKSVSRKVEVEMPFFEKDNIDVSDVLFVEELNLNQEGKLAQFVPKVNSNFSRKSPYIYIYNEIYSKEYPATVQIRYQLENMEEDIELDTIMVKELQKPLTSQVFKLDKRNLSKNRYRCIVKVKRGNSWVERYRTLSFYWIDTPETSQDLSLALRQMRYILPTDSSDKYLDAPASEQKAFFTSFWAERDPNPNTETNELMEEYFSRVNFANREFSSFNNDGWLSDRGRILIKFGFPDDVERHPFEMDSVPYVIWRYYGLRKVFVFTDPNGFGDYRLHPNYQHQEY